MQLISLYKALADITRLRCMSLLIENGELCVCEITYALDMAQPKISHHLANLRQAKLVVDRKQGLWIYYQVNPNLPLWVLDSLNSLVVGAQKEDIFIADQATLAQMPNRPRSVHCA